MRRVPLARALSKLGVLSRSQAELAVAAGRVAVDGTVVRDPQRPVDVARQRLAVDGVEVAAAARLHLLVHKPSGLVTTRSDELGRPTVMDLLPAGTPFVSPVGRLDLDSSGLLLFTNDTALADAVSGPASRLAKTYEVELDVPLRAEHVERMRLGMTLPDGTVLAPVAVTFADGGDRRRARFVLREGRNRQIRRMAEAMGRTVLRLHRTAIGPLQLGDLAPGAVRPLTQDELAALLAALRHGR